MQTDLESENLDEYYFYNFRVIEITKQFSGG